jgi:hypothetical protein
MYHVISTLTVIYHLFFDLPSPYFPSVIHELERPTRLTLQSQKALSKCFKILKSLLQQISSFHFFITLPLFIFFH